jgi:hypothetical protein
MELTMEPYWVWAWKQRAPINMHVAYQLYLMRTCIAEVEV